MAVDFEWNYFILFGAGVLVFLTAGIPFLNGLVGAQGVLVAFPLFLLLYAVMAYVLGLVVHSGFKGMVLFVAGFIASDIWVPPMMVPITGPTVLTAGQSLASDVFFYQLFLSQGLAHIVSWWLTYLAVPLVAMAVFLVYLSGSDLKEALRGVFK